MSEIGTVEPTGSGSSVTMKNPLALASEVWAFFSIPPMK
jgi:hypothetical protein